MLTKKYQAKPVTIDSIRFPSQAEGECYKILKAWVRHKNISLKCHNPVRVGIYTWKVDFTLFPLTATAKKTLSHLAARFNRQLHNNCIFVEYKGIIDKNFNTKFQYYCKQHTTFSNSVILVSSRDSGYTTIKKDKIVTHPILSLKNFKLLLNFN